MRRFLKCLLLDNLQTVLLVLASGETSLAEDNMPDSSNCWREREFRKLDRMMKGPNFYCSDEYRAWSQNYMRMEDGFRKLKESGAYQRTNKNLHDDRPDKKVKEFLAGRRPTGRVVVDIEAGAALAASYTESMRGAGADHAQGKNKKPGFHSATPQALSRGCSDLCSCVCTSSFAGFRGSAGSSAVFDKDAVVADSNGGSGSASRWGKNSSGQGKSSPSSGQGKSSPNPGQGKNSSGQGKSSSGQGNISSGQGKSSPNSGQGKSSPSSASV